ncbi:MAG: 4-alpha-glucanotransferase [Firmicutes bacterium]|uniref:4-alpha-glucanotransferase n=1 Tax=Candidatus Onthovivens merdipullorum TaxID=2840889 RepID=A0A9D9GY66_9BACL|nr:4-alpha-glucanotransferase [Candidatus Onthovivens merdipullorum]
MRSNGILCPIASLPSKYGIGDLGYPSYEFIDLISEAKIKYWQILPLNPIDFCHSPYASSCDSAIDPIYVSLDLLKERGLLNRFKHIEFNKEKIEYDKVREYKLFYLKNAYKNQKDTDTNEFKLFVSENSWLEKYALFEILLKKNHNKVLYEWKKADKEAFYHKEGLITKYQKQLEFIYWVQFELFRELDLLKDYMHNKEIELIGDLPFYVGLNSSDYFGHLDEFQIDEETDRPLKVGGVPPDYFSPLGQKWGNPCYDVEYMRSTGYIFFLNRIKKALRKYDILRLDHFRAFDTYYEIPFDAKDAKIGEWKKGLGEEFFKKVEEEGLLNQLIVEDLGDVFPSVYKLRDEFNLPGMNILQFTCLNNYDEVIENQIVYTGSHDNETIVGFYKNMKKEDKNLLEIKFKYAGIDRRKKINYRFISLAFSYPCKLAIIPIQDYLGLDNKARINTPGTSTNNWEFRLSSFKEFKKEIPNIIKTIEEYER